MSCFFTSDLHINHANIIEHCRRPFAHVDEMNSALLKNWNRVVTPKDSVYVIGDFALCRHEVANAFARGLNGTKFLVAGNHDFSNRKKYGAGAPANGPFQWVKDLAEIDVNGQKIVMCHYALLTWNKSHRGSWMLHGHSHGSLPDDKHARRIDVGVDCNDFTPLSFEQVSALMSRKLWKPVDHHVESL